MRSKIVGLCCLFIVLIQSGCNFSSEPKDGLPYEEYLKGAQLYESKGDGEQAISYYKKALKIKPNDAKTHTALGRLYDTEGQKSYREAFSKYSLDILTNQNKRRNKDQTKELEEYGFKSQYKTLALKEYTEAIKLDHDQWQARYFVATDHYNNKRYNDAIKEYVEVLRSNPNCTIAYSVLASSYLGVRQYDLALENIEMAHNLDNDDEYYYFCLGKAYYFMKDENRGFEMERKLKAMSSKYYQDLLDYRFSHNREP